MTAACVVQLYHEGFRLAVAGPAGRKYVPVVLYDIGNLHVTKLPKDAARKFVPPAGKRPCSIARVARKLLANGRRWGMTQGARELLEQALAGAKS